MGTGLLLCEVELKPASDEVHPALLQQGLYGVISRNVEVIFAKLCSLCPAAGVLAKLDRISGRAQR